MEPLWIWVNGFRSVSGVRWRFRGDASMGRSGRSERYRPSDEPMQLTRKRVSFGGVTRNRVSGWKSCGEGGQ